MKVQFESQKPAAAERSSAPVMAVVIPVYNERDNINAIISAVAQALVIDFEVVFVDDDSNDGTRDQIISIAKQDSRVRLIHRIGRRGLSTAVIEGFLSTHTPYIAVIDADLQHDESILPDMLELLRQGIADIAVGSRYTKGGSIGEWGHGRARLSSVGTRLAKIILKSELADPMSGFFAINRSAFDSAVRHLSGRGYKLL